MTNQATEGYSFGDKLFRGAANSLSYMIGVKNVTRPFWNRWRFSLLDHDTIARFLGSIDSLEQWADHGLAFVQNEAKQLELDLSRGLARDEHITRLRRLSYLAHMAQWGIIPINEQKLTCYRLSRDFYIEAERLAHGDRFVRFEVPWHEGKRCWANLHLPEGTGPFPVLLAMHGMDDTKEEHLGQELAAQAAGFAVLSLDGPGQAESLFCENVYWESDHHLAARKALDMLQDYNVVLDHVSVLGISWGGMWAYKLAAVDPRVGAIYDLGGPIDANMRHFSRLPWFLKSKFCQVLGVDPTSIIDPALFAPFGLSKEELEALTCKHIRITHGDKDPLVRTVQKRQLMSQLQDMHADCDVSILVYPDGDHCCTQHLPEIRGDFSKFFVSAYERRTQSSQ